MSRVSAPDVEPEHGCGGEGERSDVGREHLGLTTDQVGDDGADEPDGREWEVSLRTDSA